MKKIVLTTYSKIIAWLLTIAGFAAACDSIEPRVEYGTPTADFVVKGKVTDKTTKQPIGNMAVINKARTSPYGNDTTKTNANGEYELKFKETSFGAENLTIYTSDLDGDANRAYLSDTVRIKASDLKPVKKGDKRWYAGTFEGTANFNLTENKLVAEYGVPAATYKKIEKDN